MNLIPFLAASAVATISTLIFLLRLRQTRPWRGLAAGVAAIAVTLLALDTATGTAGLTVEGVTFLITPYARVLGSVSLVVGLLSILIAATDAPEPAAVPVLLVAVTGLVIATSCSEVGVSLTLVAAAALIATAIAIGFGVYGTGERRAEVLLRESRGVVLGLLGGLAATALIGNGTPGSGAGGLPVEPTVAGLAFAAVAVVVAHRFGAVPLHVRVARITETAHAASLPAILVILPAAWGAVLLAWSAPAIAEYAGGLPVERGLIVALTMVALIVGSVAALFADSAATIVTYLIVAESGFGLLALATVDPTAAGAARTWLVVFVAGRTALIGWAMAFRAVFGTGQMHEAAGWVRRAPVLAATLVVTAVAGIGWPGTVAWDARVAILEASTGGPLLLLAYAASLGTVIAVGRLVLVGLRPSSELVTAAPHELPRLPAGAESAGLRSTLSINRTPLRALGMTVLAVAALVVSAGGFGLAAASASGAPKPIPTSAPSAEPGASVDPGPSLAPDGSAEPPVEPDPSVEPDLTPAP